MTLPAEVGVFVERLTTAVADTLGEHLVGVYLIGSCALDDFQPTSDIDVVAVSSDDLPAASRATLRARVLDLAMQAPARGLEFVLYSAADAAAANGTVTLSLNAGPAMTTRTDTAEEFWFAIDASILRTTAVALVGPPARDVFGEVDHERVLRAVVRSLRWHATHGDRPHASVLTACRAWRYALQGVWSSKSAAGAWVAAQAPETAPLIVAAQSYRTGQSTTEVPAEDAVAFVHRVRAALERPALT